MPLLKVTLIDFLACEYSSSVFHVIKIYLIFIVTSLAITVFDLCCIGIQSVNQEVINFLNDKTFYSGLEKNDISHHLLELWSYLQYVHNFLSFLYPTFVQHLPLVYVIHN